MNLEILSITLAIIQFCISFRCTTGHSPDFPIIVFIVNLIGWMILGLLIPSSLVNLTLLISLTFVVLFFAVAVDAICYRKPIAQSVLFFILLIYVIYELYPKFSQGLWEMTISSLIIFIFIFIGITTCLLFNRMNNLSYYQFEIAGLLSINYFLGMILGYTITTEWLS